MDVRVGTTMMAEEQKSLAECVRKGMKHLEREEYDDALAEFEKRPENEHYFVAYGRATALFRKGRERENIDLDGIDRIINLYETAIKLDSAFPDAYLMAAYAYVQKAGLLHQGKKDRDTLENIYKTLCKAEIYLIKTKTLNHHFVDASFLENVTTKKKEAQVALDIN